VTVDWRQTDPTHLLNFSDAAHRKSSQKKTCFRRTWSVEIYKIYYSRLVSPRCRRTAEHFTLTRENGLVGIERDGATTEFSSSWPTTETSRLPSLLYRHTVHAQYIFRWFRSVCWGGNAAYCTIPPCSVRTAFGIFFDLLN